MATLTLSPKFSVGDRVWYHHNDPSDTGTVTEVIVTRDRAVELLKVEYSVQWDHGHVDDTFEAYVLEPVKA